MIAFVMLKHATTVLQRRNVVLVSDTNMQCRHDQFKQLSSRLLLSACLFRNFLPSLSQSVDGAVDERGADLQHAVVVVHTATDVCDRRPLLNARRTLLHVRPAHYLRHHQAARLQHTPPSSLTVS